jgi:hypothetical protein
MHADKIARGAAAHNFVRPFLQFVDELVRHSSALFCESNMIVSRTMAVSRQCVSFITIPGPRLGSPVLTRDFFLLRALLQTAPRLLILQLSSK